MLCAVVCTKASGQRRATGIGVGAVGGLRVSGESHCAAGGWLAEETGSAPAWSVPLARIGVGELRRDRELDAKRNVCPVVMGGSWLQPPALRLVARTSEGDERRQISLVRST